MRTKRWAMNVLFVVAYLAVLVTVGVISGYGVALSLAAIGMMMAFGLPALERLNQASYAEVRRLP